MHVKLEYKRVQLGENGCKRMMMNAFGRSGHGVTQNKARRVHLGPSRSGFGPYDRGNFHDHDVLWVLPKTIKHGCRWVIMDAYGCNGGMFTGGNKNTTKSKTKWLIRSCFWMHGQGQKIHHIGKDGDGVQGGSRGEIKEK